MQVTRVFRLHGALAGQDLVLPLVGVRFDKGKYEYTGSQENANNLAKYLSDGYGAKWSDKSDDSGVAAAAEDKTPEQLFASGSAMDDQHRTNTADVRTVGTQLEATDGVNVAGRDQDAVTERLDGGGGLPGADVEEVATADRADRSGAGKTKAGAAGPGTDPKSGKPAPATGGVNDAKSRGGN